MRNKRDDIVLVSELLGQEIINATMVYTKSTEEEKERAVKDMYR
ncbi:MAG: hypothetical protein H0Z35_00545 [Thermoanaerobacteraceae bacterium]|nr:hypothetical protein [Thermoanaerobacteraceae bacterium]